VRFVNGIDIEIKHAKITIGKHGMFLRFIRCMDDR